MYLLGSAHTFTGNVRPWTYNGKTEKSMLGIETLGMRSDPSSSVGTVGSLAFLYNGSRYLYLGGGETTAFARPGALTLIGNTLYICNQGSYKVRTLNIQTNTVRDYRVFDEKVYKYLNIGAKEFVWLKSGLYRLD